MILKIAIYGPWLIDDRRGNHAIKEELLGNWDSYDIIVFEGPKEFMWRQVKNLLKMSHSGVADRGQWERKAARTLLSIIFHQKGVDRASNRC